MIPPRFHPRFTLPLTLLLVVVLGARWSPASPVRAAGPGAIVTVPSTVGSSDDTCVANVFPGNDDGSVGPFGLGVGVDTNGVAIPQVLPFNLNFFGGTHAYLYVNNNGNVTFDNAFGSYTPTGLSGGNTPPMIAPYWSDVETIVAPAGGSQDVTYGAGYYGGLPAFCVDWVNVGYYNNHTDKLNSYQLVIVDRSDRAQGDFDFYFNYNKIQWETGDASGGQNGFGGTPADVGYSNGVAGSGGGGGGGGTARPSSRTARGTTATSAAGAAATTKPSSDAHVQAPPASFRPHLTAPHSRAAAVRPAARSNANGIGADTTPAAGNVSFELPGSRTTMAFEDLLADGSPNPTGLIYHSLNSETAGRYAFVVASGVAPTGSTVTGAVLQAGASGSCAASTTPVPNVAVEIIGAQGFSRTVAADSAGHFTFAGVPADTYTIRSFTPFPNPHNLVNGSGMSDPLTVSGVATDSFTDNACEPVAPAPPPTVYWGNPFTVTTTTCAGATVTYTMTPTSESPNQHPIPNVPMTEGPAGSYSAGLPPTPDSPGPEGQYGVSFRGYTPVYHGPMTFSFTVHCPDGTTPNVPPEIIYVDPSGTVRNSSHGNIPVAGATVTLLRSDTGAPGSFTVVPNHNTGLLIPVMDASNTTNPDTSTALGEYGWNVITGFYQVQVKMAGCTPGTGPNQTVDPSDPNAVLSSVLQIPPAVTGLDLFLSCPVPDTTPPVITPTVTGTAGTNGWYTSNVTVSWSVTDAESGIASQHGCASSTVTTDTAGTTFTCAATNGAGLSDSKSVTIKRDATAPTITCAVSPNSIWPPNHKLVTVNATVNVTDATSGPAGFTLVSAASNEPDTSADADDTANDIQGFVVGTADASGQVRAERLGSGNGRVYTLTYQGKDQAGNTATCSATIKVPHDQGRGR